jgi:Chromo (CHRromatin Organisation MOdifier) domain
VAKKPRRAVAVPAQQKDGGGSSLSTVKAKTGPPPIDAEDDQWLAEKLVGHRRIGKARKGRFQYKVRYSGYSSEHDKWQAPVDIHPELIEAYTSGLDAGYSIDRRR